MIEIWTESTIFNTIRKGLADQAKILKKGRFSDREILELGGQINREEYEQAPLIHTETLNSENRTETQNTEKGQVMHASSPKQMLSSEDKITAVLVKKKNDWKKGCITSIPETRVEKKTW